MCLLCATPGLTVMQETPLAGVAVLVSYVPTTLLQLTDPPANINNCNIPQHGFRLPLEYNQRKMSGRFISQKLQSKSALSNIICIVKVMH